jgi:hypothetical protein
VCLELKLSNTDITNCWLRCLSSPAILFLIVIQEAQKDPGNLRIVRVPLYFLGVDVQQHDKLKCENYERVQKESQNRDT